MKWVTPSRDCIRDLHELQRLIKHYRALVREADVTRYWSVAPWNVEEESAAPPTHLQA